MDAKKWYTSKILWAAVVTIVLGAIPLIADLLRIVMPQSLEVATAIMTFVSGICTLVFRVLFTNQPLE
jgi:hypothetical protein